MKSFVSLILFLLVISVAPAQEIFSPKDPGETPNRTYDVLHYKIEIKLNDSAKSVEGKVTTTFVPLLPALKTAVFDAGEMKIKSVKDAKGKDLKFTSTTSSVSIEFDKPHSYRDTLKVSIEYSCTPKQGLTFNNTSGAIPGKRSQIWSQGEETTNHFWFPCYDYPNDKSTSEVIGTVDARYSFLSNGKLISVTENKKEKTKTFHWKETKPHSSYLIMIAAGEYTILRDNLGKLPLEYWVYTDDTTNGRASFKYTPAMIKFFNETIGFDYPWEKYAQIILQDHFGGMENTSATTLSDTWAVSDARGRIDNPSTSLLAHELVHQWWGDLVTCRDFRHMWLNESFASYYDPLFHRMFLGQDEFDYTLYQNQQAGVVVDTTRGRKPIVSVESYGENVYPRGAAVLHMLRFLLGDDLYHRAIKHYITKHAFQPVETNDLKIAIEESTGQNLQWFFDQWVYKAGHPVFAVSYQWDESAKHIALNVRQTQKTDSLTGVFRMPVDIEITTSAGATTHRIEILTKDSTYMLPVASRPSLVIFDKGDWLIKQLKFEKSFDEWKYQAMSATSLVDRILGIQALARMQKEGDVFSVFIDRMLHDSFWAVRRDAASQISQALAKYDSLRPAAKSALFAAIKDKRSEVRAVAAGALRWLRGNDVTQVLNGALNDSSYQVFGRALASIAKVDSAHALPVVKRYLTVPSRQNIVAGFALNALGTLDTAQAVAVAMEMVKDQTFTSTRFTSLSTIRWYGKGRGDAMAVVKEILKDPNESVRNYAALVLGDIGDASVIPALEALGNDKENPASATARQSVEKINKRINAVK
ncbi:MAG: M1 family aminopeptidase [Ignavibacteriales bacterium]|nr:M1 family aminopeptidase [Ignavibacteriales bacterium]